MTWHEVNGQPAKDILPAILITTRHPQDFQLGLVQKGKGYEDNLLLIPLRSACKSHNDVIPLVERIFEDIKGRKTLSKFQITTELARGNRGALVDAIILRPTIKGVGIDIKELTKWFRAKRKQK